MKMTFHRIGLKYLIIILIISAKSIKATKWLIDNPGFDSIGFWLSDYLPCSLDEIIFPEDYEAVLPLPKEVEASGFVLPREGAILFSHDSTINFGGDQKKRDCENDDYKAYVGRPRSRSWYDPASWRTTPDMSRNAAMLHEVRVPCDNESVIIQGNGPLMIDLQYVQYLRIGQMSLAGSIISKAYLKDLLQTDIGQIMFHHSRGVSVEYYRDDVCGCHKDFKTLSEPICFNVWPYCERPRCLNAFLPSEGCCEVCGAQLSFVLDGCDDIHLHKLTKVISMAISDQGLASDIDFHVTYVSTNLLQAIIVDRDTYSEKSVAFVQRLNATTDWAKVFSRPYQTALRYSGRPYNGGVTFGSVLLIIICLLFVVYVGLVICSHYAPDNRYIRMIPPWVLEPRRWPEVFSRSNVVFARFHNAGAGATEEHVENLTMRFNAQRDDMRECAFDNPMFTEGVAATAKQEEAASEPNTETQSLVSVNISVADEQQKRKIEEQELTEIKLESASESSDEEETRE